MLISDCSSDVCSSDLVEIEAVVGQLGPARQRLPVLDLFGGPPLGGALEVRIVWKDIAEIGRVVAAVILDHARGLDDLHQLGIDLAGVETLPRKIGRESCRERVGRYVEI